MKVSPFSIILIFIALATIGLGLVPRLNLRYLPNSAPNSLSINYSWPGAAPSAVEQQITAVLEGNLALVRGIRKIYSISRAGRGNIRLEVEESADIDLLRFEIASKLRQVYPSLPPDAGFPVLSVDAPDESQEESPVLTYTLSGNDLPTNLYGYAREVAAPHLSAIPGLNRIEVRGGNQKEWRVIYDPAKLAMLGLKQADLSIAFQRRFGREALGTTTDGAQNLYVKLDHPPLKDWKHIVIATKDRRMIYLGDVANVELREQPPRHYYRINGQNSIRLLFFAEPDANTLVLANQIKRAATGLVPSLPPSYQLRLEEDATRFLQEELRKIQWRSLLSLGILLLFVLLVYRNIRFLLLVLGSLLINLGIAAGFYYFLSVEINLYALAGITVSFGIIIDNIIVMGHHVRRHRDLRVFPALLASTLTTISALVILYFLPEEWRHNLTSFAQVMAINLGVSLLVALWLVPALVKRLAPYSSKLQDRSRHALLKRLGRFALYERMLRGLHRFRSLVIILMILTFGLPVFLLPNNISGWEWYNRNLGADWYVESVKPVVNRLLGGTLRLFMWYVYEGSAYRTPEETVLYVQGSLPQGATVHQLNSLFEQIEGYLSRYPAEIRQFTTRISSGQYGNCKIIFNEGYDLTFPFQLKNRLISQSINLGGAEWNIYGVGRGFSSGSSAQPPSYQIAMYGYHKAQLAELAKQFAGILLKHPRVQEVDTEGNINWWEKDRYLYQMDFDQQELAAYQLAPDRIVRRLQPFDQAIRSDLRLPDGLPLRLVNARQTENDLWLLNNATLSVDSQRIVQHYVSTMEKIKAAPAIHKENQQYIQMVAFEYLGSARFGNRHLEESMAAMQKAMPLGYSMERRRFSFFTKKEAQQLGGLIALVIGFIFFICAIQFESFRQAFAIIVLIPLSFIGIFLTFYWFDFAFDQGGYTAFLLVSGLTVNSLILIINDFNYYRKRQPQRDQFQTYLKAFRQKITPILLTIFSTALGLTPFLISGNEEAFWFALAVGTIGGLFFSVVVLVLVVPLMFVGLERG